MKIDGVGDAIGDEIEVGGDKAIDHFVAGGWILQVDGVGVVEKRLAWILAPVSGFQLKIAGDLHHQGGTRQPQTCGKQAGECFRREQRFFFCGHSVMAEVGWRVAL